MTPRWVASAAILLACGAPARSVDIAPPVPAVRAETPRSVRSPRVAIPGARLHAIVASGPLPIPYDWVAEKPELDGVWPTEPALALREAWVASSRTVCREASWASDADVLVSKHPWFAELRAGLAGDERARRAEQKRYGARAILRVERACMYHECRPPLAPPLTTFAICVDDLDALSMRGFTRAIMSLHLSLAPLAPLLGLEGVSEEVAEYRRDRNAYDEVEVTLGVTADGQKRARAWLLASGYAVPDTTVAWQLASTDPQRAFIMYPIENAPNTFSISGQ